MNWIRVHYDRASVLVAAVFLLSSALLIAWKVSRFGQNFPALQTAPLPKPALALPQAVEIEHAAERLRQPAQWTFSGRSRVTSHWTSPMSAFMALTKRIRSI